MAWGTVGVERKRRLVCFELSPQGCSFIGQWCMAQRECLSVCLCLSYVTKVCGIRTHTDHEQQWAHTHETQRRHDFVSINTDHKTCTLWAWFPAGLHNVRPSLLFFFLINVLPFCQVGSYKIPLISNTHHRAEQRSNVLIITLLKMSPYLTNELTVTLSQCSCGLLSLQTSTLLSNRATGISFSLPSFHFKSKQAACVCSTSFSHAILPPPL